MPCVVLADWSSVRDEVDSSKFLRRFASSSAIIRLKRCASCIASSMASWALLTRLLCSLRSGDMVSPVVFSILSLTFCSCPDDSSTPASIAFMSSGSPSSRRYTIQPLMNSGLEQLTTIISRMTLARIWCRNTLAGRQLYVLCSR